MRRLNARAAKAAAVAIKAPAGRRCPTCLGPLNSPSATFCGNVCRMTWHNARAQLGTAVLDMALIWRRYRRPGDFTRLCRMLDKALAHDRAAGVHHYREPDPYLTAAEHVA